MSINRGAYAQYEDSIYECIMTYEATKAELSWTFLYANSTQTKPTGIIYNAVYTGGSCTSTTQYFSNGV